MVTDGIRWDFGFKYLKLRVWKSKTWPKLNSNRHLAVFLKFSKHEVSVRAAISRVEFDSWTEMNHPQSSETPHGCRKVGGKAMDT